MKTSVITLLLIASHLLAVCQTGQSWYYNIDQNNLGVNGYDVVSYHNEDQPIKGSEAFSLAHQDVQYYFASEKNLVEFKESPEKYLPAYGGWCAYRMAQKPEEVGWAQSRIPVDPTLYKMINGKLYLFSKVAGDAKAEWEKRDEDEMLKRANDFWSSRITLAQMAKGKPELLNPTARMENLLWERFMGKWNGTGEMLVSLDPKKYAPYPSAEWTFWYGFDGYCIQDEWVTSNDIGGTWNGPAIRGYDPMKKEWHMTFIPVNAGRDGIWLMTGNFNDKNELEGQVEGKDSRGNDYIQKIYFYDISENSFKWRADRSYDNGNTWIENFLKIEAQRQ